MPKFFPTKHFNDFLLKWEITVEFCLLMVNNLWDHSDLLWLKPKIIVYIGYMFQKEIHSLLSWTNYNDCLTSHTNSLYTEV